jgi:hypothetical protein
MRGYFHANGLAEAPPTPAPSPPRAARAEGGEKKQSAVSAAKSADHDLPYGAASEHNAAAL